MTAPINHWPLPWRIAAALALESGLDWGRWAYGLTSACTCVPYQRDEQEHHEVDCRGSERLREMKATHGSRLGEVLWTSDAVPVPDPSDAEAYRADCARRGVEPGPMPALWYRWLEVDGERWCVQETGSPGREITIVRICVDRSNIVLYGSEDSGTLYSLADMARCVALATAAARAMGVT